MMFGGGILTGVFSIAGMVKSEHDVRREGWRKDTTGWVWEWNMDVAGGRAKGRTYRRACRPPNGSSDFCDDLGPLYGGHIVATSKFTL